MRIVMRITQSAPTEHLQRLDCILLGSFRAIGTSILILVIRLVSRQRPAIYLNKLPKPGLVTRAKPAAPPTRSALITRLHPTASHRQYSLKHTGKSKRLIQHQVMPGVGNGDHRYMPTATLTHIVSRIGIE